MASGEPLALQEWAAAADERISELLRDSTETSSMSSRSSREEEVVGGGDSVIDENAVTAAAAAEAIAAASATATDAAARSVPRQSTSRRAVVGAGGIPRPPLGVDRSALSHKMRLAREAADALGRAEDAERTVLELRARLADARHRETQQEEKLNAVVSGHRDEARSMRSRHAEETATLRAQVADLEAKAPTREQLMAEIRAALAEPIESLLSEARYERLRMVPTERLDLGQYVTLRVFESVAAFRADAEDSRVRLAIAGERERQLVQQLDAAEDKVNDVLRRNEELCGKLKRVEREDERVIQLEAATARAQVAEKQAAQTSEYLVATERQLAAAREAGEAATKLAEKAGEEAVLLARDKAHLEHEVSVAKERCDTQAQRVLRLEQQASEAQQARDEAYEKLLAAQHSASRDRDANLQSQLDAIRERNASELEELQRQARELYARENTSLIREKDAAVARSVEASAALSEQRRAYDALLSDHRAALLERDAKVAELAAECKIKGFEADRLQVLFEESRTGIKASEAAAERATQRFGVLEREFFELKTSSAANEEKMKNEIADARARLRTYEQLEDELDNVVMHAAEAEDPEVILAQVGYGSGPVSAAQATAAAASNGFIISGVGSAGSAVGSAGDVGGIVGGGATIPTTAQRRLRQSVSLARKLLQAQKQCAQKAGDLEAANAALKRVTGQLQSAQALLKQAAQPQQYLVETVQRRDATVADLTTRLALSDAELKARHEERARLVRTINALQSDLERLLDNQRTVEQLAGVVRRLEMSPPTATTPIAKDDGSSNGRVFNTMGMEGLESAAAVEFPSTAAPHTPPSAAAKSGVPGWFIQLEREREQFA